MDPGPFESVLAALSRAEIRYLVVGFPIDLFTRMGGRRYADLLPHRRVPAGAAPIPYVDASRRPQDRLDVEALRRIQRGG